MKKCKKCMKDIPVKAKVCPECKSKLTMPVWQKILIVIGAFIVIGAIGSNGNKATPTKVATNKKVTATIQATPTPTLSAEAKKKMEEAKLKADYDKWIESQFSPWDGSHMELVKLLKKNLNDPDSYEHVETKYWDQKDGILIKMTYRAKNAFGGLILQNVTAKADYKTNMINIISQNN